MRRRRANAANLAGSFWRRCARQVSRDTLGVGKLMACCCGCGRGALDVGNDRSGPGAVCACWTRIVVGRDPATTAGAQVRMECGIVVWARRRKPAADWRAVVLADLHALRGDPVGLGRGPRSAMSSSARTLVRRVNQGRADGGGGLAAGHRWSASNPFTPAREGRAGKGLCCVVRSQGRGAMSRIDARGPRVPG